MIITKKRSILTPPAVNKLPVDQTGAIVDITDSAIKKQFVRETADRTSAILASLRQATPARLGLGRIGTRYKTISTLRLRADHAAAQDAVWQEVPDDFVAALNLLPLRSTCHDEADYLTRPDHGRLLDQPSKMLAKSDLPTHPNVLIAIGDGLSSAAITANTAAIIPIIKKTLAAHGIAIGKMPFIKYCRVGAEDELGELTQADVVCLLIGERPGLATPKSMSAYVAYQPTIGMPEARRTVISNIHSGGIPAPTAGDAVAKLILNMLRYRASGLELKRKMAD